MRGSNESATRRSSARSLSRPRICSSKSCGRREERAPGFHEGLLRTKEGYMLLHPVAPGLALLLERRTVRCGCLQQAIGFRVLRALQLSELLLFFLTLLREFLLPLFEPIIAFGQEYSEG